MRLEFENCLFPPCLATPHFVKICGVVGCTRQHDSLFLLPTSEPLRKKWLDSICDGHGPNNIPKRLYVCARHFMDECFFNMGPYSSGLAQILRIKKDHNTGPLNKFVPLFLFKKMVSDLIVSNKQENAEIMLN
uniref:THAP-type domain-containing protein n=1 Tax=Sphaeramia orbicularis TaxID=375764 RepID=A0A673D181_9TELE